MSDEISFYSEWYEKELLRREQLKSEWIVTHQPCPDCDEKDSKWMPLSKDDLFFLRFGRFPCVLERVEYKKDND